jgi:hypothetical protein
MAAAGLDRRPAAQDITARGARASHPRFTRALAESAAAILLIASDPMNEIKYGSSADGQRHDRYRGMTIKLSSGGRGGALPPRRGEA